MKNYKKIEFYIKPDGGIMIDDNGECRQYTEHDRDFSRDFLEMIGVQYPEAALALAKQYARSKLNLPHYEYLMASRFIRCNFAKFDGLTYDIDENILHIEDVPCPIKCECPLSGVICNPRPLGLTKRETEIAKLYAIGKTYDEISMKLAICPSTIKNILQKIKKKLKLQSSKDIAKIIIAAAI